MTSTRSRYEYFNALHRSFSELYPPVNQHVIKLYIHPRRFISETKPVIQSFMQTCSIPGKPGRADLQTREMTRFVERVDKFTHTTIELFKLHHVHVSRCSAYMQSIEQLGERKNGTGDTRYMTECIGLTPRLIEMHNGLRDLADRAEHLMTELSTLEENWAQLNKNLICKTLS